MQRKLIWLLLLCVTLGASRAQSQQPRSQQPRSQQPKIQPAPRQPVPKASPSTSGKPSTLIQSGPGIVVGDPLAAGSDAELVAFGAACGRWLHLVIGGHGELGKTPTWGALYTISREMGRKDLRLQPEDVPKLATKLGVTHVAVGRIEGSLARSTLTYQLWEAASRKAVGQPLSVTGSAAEVLAALPAMARQLGMLLGVKTPRIPDAVGATPAEMSVMGRFLQGNTGLTQDVEVEQIRRAAAKSPLAGMLVLVLDSSWSGTVRYKRVKALLGQAGDNLLVLHSLVAVSGEEMRAQEAMVKRVVAQFPHSFLSRSIEGVWHHNRGERVEQRRAVWQATQAAPRSPLAWLQFGDAFSDEASDIRKGRYYSALSDAESDAIAELYERWFDAAQRATELDPQSATAWLELSKAAQFSGDAELADTAFDKALAIDKRNIAIYRWGLQAYQPKWADDSAKLMAIAEMAADAEFYMELRNDIASALHNSDRNDGRNRVLAKIYKRSQNAALREPKEPDLHGRMGVENLNWGDVGKAVASFNLYVQSHPIPAIAHRRVAADYTRRGMFPQALPALQQAAQLEPMSAETYVELGQNYGELQQWDKAKGTYQRAIELDPTDPYAHSSYATALLHLKDYEGSIKSYQEAIRLHPGCVAAYQGMSFPYRNTKQWQKSLDAMNAAVELAPNLAATYQPRAIVAWMAARYELVGPSVKAYFGLGRNIADGPQMGMVAAFAARRLGQDAEANAFINAAARGTSANWWPHPVLRYLLREITADQLLKIATGTDQQTEAHFYLALDLLSSGHQDKKDTAVEHLKWVVQYGNQTFIEYEMAIAELEWLGIPVPAAAVT